MNEVVPQAVGHPAPFPAKVLNPIRALMSKYGDPDLAEGRLLDPFCGVGTVVQLGPPWECFGCEIEREWAAQAQDVGVAVHVGTAEKMPWPDGHFSAVVTSPAYGNRLADSYAPDMSDPKHRHRRSYRISLGRPLSDGSGASVYWGAKYRSIHQAVWQECVRILALGGLFILNCKDHMKRGELQPVTEWHVRTLLELGLEPVTARPVQLVGDQNTNTMRARGIQVIDHEWLVVLRKPTAIGARLDDDEIDAWLKVNLYVDEQAPYSENPIVALFGEPETKRVEGGQG